MQPTGLTSKLIFSPKMVPPADQALTRAFPRTKSIKLDSYLCSGSFKKSTVRAGYLMQISSESLKDF